MGTYGTTGYALLDWSQPSDIVSLPAGDSLIIDHAGRWQWTTAGGSDVRDLQSPDGTTREATCLFDGSQIRLHLSLTAAYSGTLHLYALDWDRHARREAITVNDGSGPKTANITTDFSNGAWASIPVSVAAGGTVTITVDNQGPVNAVLSGLFLD